VSVFSPFRWNVFFQNCFIIAHLRGFYRGNEDFGGFITTYLITDA